MKSFLLKQLLVITVLVILGTTTTYAAFQDATQSPPGGNPPPPVNVGSAWQKKSGNLGASSIYVGSETSNPNFDEDNTVGGVVDRFLVKAFSRFENHIAIRMPNGQSSWVRDTNFAIDTNGAIAASQGALFGGILQANGLVMLPGVNSLTPGPQIQEKPLCIITSGQNTSTVVKCQSPTNTGTTTTVSSGITDGQNLGTGAGVFAQKATTAAGSVLQFKTLLAEGDLTITNTAQEIVIKPTPNKGPSSVFLYSPLPIINNNQFDRAITVRRTLHTGGSITNCRYMITGGAGDPSSNSNLGVITAANSWSQTTPGSWGPIKTYGSNGNPSESTVSNTFACEQIFSSGCNGSSGTLVAQLHIKCYNGNYGQNEYSPVYASTQISWTD